MNDNILWLNKLVPKHVLLDDSEVEGKLEPLNVKREQLPRILLKDPAGKDEQIPLMSTDVVLDPITVIESFVSRWNQEAPIQHRSATNR